MRINILIAFLLFASLANGQKSTRTFGQISKSDLAMTVYERDSLAVAVYLLDFFSQTLMDYKAVYAQERHVRIKILKEEGLDHANVVIPVYGYNKPDIKAATYSLENGVEVVTAVNEENLLKEKISRGFHIYTIVFPKVKKGSIIEYIYRIESNTFQNCLIQQSIPVRESEVWCSMLSSYSLKHRVQGSHTPTVETIDDTGSRKIYHWKYENLPAFEIEPLMGSAFAHVQKVEFSYLSSWNWFNTNLVDNRFFIGQISDNPFLKKITREIIAGISDPMTKAEMLYSFVQNHYTRTNSNPVFVDLKESFNESAASPLEINLTLASMLHKAGIESSIALLATKEYGVVDKDFPERNQFNYAVCFMKIDDKIFVLDASEKNLPMGYLPEQCINGDGFLISGVGPAWIPLNFFPPSKTSVKSALTLGSDQNFSGNITIVRDGYDALNARNKIVELGQEAYVNTVKAPNWNVHGAKVLNLKNLKESLKEEYNLTVERTDKTSKIIYISPLPSERILENPFKSLDRKYPVCFPSTQESLVVGTITVPGDYSIEELPKGTILTLSDGSIRYTFSVTVMNNVINVMSQLKINKTTFNTSEYRQLREIFAQIVAKQAEQIVLKRNP